MGRRHAVVPGVLLVRVSWICSERYSGPPAGPAASTAADASDRLRRSAALAGDLAAAAAVGLGCPVLCVSAGGVRTGAGCLSRDDGALFRCREEYRGCRCALAR